MNQTDGTGLNDGLSRESANPSVEMLNAAVQAATNLCLASEHFTERLGEIEDQIEDACNIEAVRVMRFRLTEYLQQLRDQTLHQREKMTSALEQLSEQLEIAQGVKSAKPANVPPAADGLTGLQARGGAERALSRALESRSPAYAALFVVDQLHLINARYGYSTGDEMLRQVCGHLKSRMSPGDRLFRWTGPAFVALMERVESTADIQQEINRMGLAQLKVTVQIGNGSVLFPISTLPLLVPLAGVKTLPELTRRLDAFIGEQSRH